MKRPILLTNMGGPSNLDEVSVFLSTMFFELRVKYRDLTQEIGFETYRVAKASNDHPSSVQCISNLYESMKSSEAQKG